MEGYEDYSEYLLDWCKNIHLNWEKRKSRYTNLFDLKSLEEWEQSCLELKEKLEANSKEDYENYKTAMKLYEQWELLYREAHSYLVEKAEV